MQIPILFVKKVSLSLTTVSFIRTCICLCHTVYKKSLLCLVSFIRTCFYTFAMYTEYSVHACMHVGMRVCVCIQYCMYVYMHACM